MGNKISSIDAGSEEYEREIEEKFLQTGTGIYALSHDQQDKQPEGLKSS